MIAATTFRPTGALTSAQPAHDPMVTKKDKAKDDSMKHDDSKPN